MVISLLTNRANTFKTTIAINIAISLMLEKKNVVLLDLDSNSGIIKILNRLKAMEPTLYSYLTNDKIKTSDILDYSVNKIYYDEFKSMKSIYGTLAIINNDESILNYEDDFLNGKIKHDRLDNLIKELNNQFDYVIIDNASIFNILTTISISNSDLTILPTNDTNIIDSVLWLKRHKVNNKLNWIYCVENTNQLTTEYITKSNKRLFNAAKLHNSIIIEPKIHRVIDRNLKWSWTKKGITEFMNSASQSINHTTQVNDVKALSNKIMQLNKGGKLSNVTK